MGIISNKGFGLAETIFSTVILAILLMAGMDLFFMNDQYSTQSTLRHLALQKADSLMEESVALGYDSVGIGTTILSAEKLEVNGEIYITPTRTVSTYPGTNLKSIQLSLEWNDPQAGSQQLALETYVSK